METDRERSKVLRKKQEFAYEGAILKVYRDLVVANGRKESWDFIHHDNTATAASMLPDGDILVVRQYRSALDRFTLELSAGKVGSLKEPRVLYAFRELLEETGIRTESSETLEFLLRIDMIIVFCGGEIDIFVAQNLLPGEQHLDPDGAIDVQAYEPSELLVRIGRSEIRDTKVVTGLTAYTLEQSRSDRAQ